MLKCEIRTSPNPKKFIIDVFLCFGLIFVRTSQGYGHTMHVTGTRPSNSGV
uniref:Uncharacterized protein n=1 Tax=Arundo donax TaxID=35708 RepID=A0A0A9AP98_ARUDO